MDFQFSFPKNYTMESFVELIFVLLGAFALVILVYSLIFKYSPIRSFPSMTTLPVRSRLGILAATFLTAVSIVLSVCYDRELQQLFPNFFEYGIFPVAPFDSSDSAFVPDMLDFQV